MKRMADIVFVCDLTISMKAFLDAFVKRIPVLAQRMTADGIDWQIGFVGYGDLKKGDPFIVHPLTRDINSVVSKIVSAPTFEGGDIPESTLDAIQEAVKLFNVNDDLRDFKPVRPEADRVLIVFTDSPPHLPDENGFWEDFTVDVLKWTRTACFIVGPHVSAYEKIANETGGKLWPIKEGFSVEEILQVVDGLPETVGTIKLPWFGSKEIENPFIRLGKKVKVDDIEAKEGIDVVILFDTSGSMGEVLENVKKSAAAFVHKLSEKAKKWRIGIVEFFNWNGIRWRVYPMVDNEEDFLKNFKKVTLKIKSVFWGEKGSTKILEEAIKLVKDSNATKVFILITDGPDLDKPHEREEEIPLMEKLLKENNIVLFAVAPNVPRYHRLCEATGGKFYDLYEAQGRVDLVAIADAIKQ